MLTNIIANNSLIPLSTPKIIDVRTYMVMVRDPSTFEAMVLPTLTKYLCLRESRKIFKFYGKLKVAVFTRSLAQD